MRLDTQKGMTLAELMMASTFALFLTAGMFSFASFFTNAQYEYQSHVELTNDSRMIIEQMAWGKKEAGVANRRGIAEAVTGTIVSATQFRYTDLNGVQHTIRLNNGTIQYQRGSGGTWLDLLDPNGTAAYDATKYTTSLSFTTPANPNSVIVRVVVGKKILSKWYYGSTSTQVFYRNAG
jgi:hypothetical protein